MTPRFSQHAIAQRASLVGLAFGLAGCASTASMSDAAQARASLAKARLEAASLCCSDLGGVEAARLGAKRSRTLLGEDGAPARQFEEGPSWFVVHEVPPGDAPIQLVLRTDLVEGGRNSIPSVLVPALLRLDDSRTTLGPSEEPRLCFQRGWTRDDVGYFTRVSVDPRSTRFVVLYTRYSALGGSINYRAKGTIQTSAAIAIMDEQYNLPRSASGLVDVWVDDAAKPYALADECDGAGN